MSAGTRVVTGEETFATALRNVIEQSAQGHGTVTITTRAGESFRLEGDVSVNAEFIRFHFGGGDAIIPIGEIALVTRI
jgi:hypothetical protein